MTTTLNASTAGAGGFIATGDNSGSLALQTAGTTAVTIDTSQNVGIGTSSPQAKLNVLDSAGGTVGTAWLGSATYYGTIQHDGAVSGANIYTVATASGGGHIFKRGTTEQMRIDSSGHVLINATSTSSFSAAAKLCVLGIDGEFASVMRAPTTSTYNVISLDNPNGQVGRIQTSGSAALFLTTSDYRLKEYITPMTGALAKVALLKPVTYKWKVDGTDGQGFIAHELQDVVPDCVGGDKDAVDANGNPQYQGIDTSFLVATLTAAIQELSAKNDALTARIVALETA